MMIFSKMAINRSREGLRCEPMGPYSKKSTLQGSVYLLIWVQEGAKVVFAETGDRNFENFAVQPAGRLAKTGRNRLAGRPKTAENRPKTGRNRPEPTRIYRQTPDQPPMAAD